MTSDLSAKQKEMQIRQERRREMERHAERIRQQIAARNSFHEAVKHEVEATQRRIDHEKRVVERINSEIDSLGLDVPRTKKDLEG